MPRHLPLLALLAMLPALLSADSDRPAADLAGTVVDRSPMSLDLSPDRSLVATANHTSGTVSLVEIDSGRVLLQTSRSFSIPSRLARPYCPHFHVDDERSPDCDGWF